jgi:5-methylcytosine-specific restriction enzyme subunit McrC
VAGPSDDSIAVGINGLHLRVARQNIYQMVAYRQQPSWAGAAVALAYPLVVAEGDALPEPYEVRGLGQPVQLVFVDVGPAARKNLPAFIETLQRL